MMPFVDLTAQQQRLGSRLEAAIAAVLRHGQFVLGPEVAELERHLARRVGVAHCIGCASGSDALQLALRGLGIGPGDEVIVPGFSFVATASSVALVGARPVYVDISPATCLIDSERVEAAITPRTRAIIPVSLFGQCADMTALETLAERHDLAVLEDAAQSLGATYHGRPSGSLSRVAATSFFPSKPLGAYGDGGALFTDDDDLAGRLRSLAQHGEVARYHHLHLGLNSRLDTLQAAILLVKLECFDEELERRRAVAARYDRLLAGLPVTPVALAPDNLSTHAQYSLLLDDRDRVRARLAEADIPSAVHYPVPLYRQPAIADPECTLAACEAVCSCILSLPMHPYLKVTQQEEVVDALRVALST